jgi:polar amino acid transport system substrate-binding protein
MINQQVAQEILESMGLLVNTVSNGQEAIDAISQHSYDLVLMDLQMPEMDGYEATRRIRADAKYDNLPLIAMTAHAMAEERAQCLKAGMNEHVPKPIDPAHLYKVLSQWLKPAITPPPQQSTRRSQLEDIELPANLPGIDLHWGLERIGGNKQLYLNLLSEFVTNHGQDMAKLEACLQQSDIDDARRILHTLEGVSGNIGAQSLQQAAKELHSDLMKENASQISTLPDPFSQAFAQLFNGLRSYLAELAIPLDSMPSDVTPKAAQTDIEIDKLITSLDSLLAAGNPDAKSLFQTLHQLLNQEDTAEITERLATQISDYDFDLARDTLTTLSEHLRNR